MIKLTPSKNARLIAKQYLQQEFRKIFSDVKSKRLWKKLDNSIEDICKREGDQTFWGLVSAISDEWKLKSVFYYLSSTKFRWELQDVPLPKLTLTGMSPTIDKYTIKKCSRNPTAFLKVWQKNKKIRDEILDTGLSPHEERDSFPIIVLKIDSNFRVVDGMRRTLISLIKGKRTIKAWVGYEVNPNGKPLVNVGYCYFLSQIFERSNNQNPELEKAIMRINREIIENYRDGKEVLSNRISDWSHNLNIKRIFSSLRK